MKNSRKCRACAKLFEVDLRNRHHQNYCGRLECQRQRRNAAQKLRRRSQGTPAVNSSSRLHVDVKPTEAGWPSDHPMLIGLISMWTGSMDLEEIRMVSRRLYERGRDLLGYGLR